MPDMINKKFSFTQLQRKLPCSENNSWYSFHESNTSNPHLPSHTINTDYVLSSNHYGAVYSVQ